ncbi:MAG: hypothetical protein HXS47_14080 [Theionarchaea archaeon]|nr:hypothetical protein [Theionarchaea archaeon]
MISVYGRVLQVEFNSVFSDIMQTLEDFFFSYSMYIFIVAGLIIIYLILTRVIFRGTIYKTAKKGKVCLLTMAGEERSLDYMRKFGGMKEIEVRTIKYLRKYNSVPYKKLEEAVGKDTIRNLVENGLLKVE